jgi:hypothetical protein
MSGGTVWDLTLAMAGKATSETDIGSIAGIDS